MSNCPCLASILARILAHQAELAHTLATNHQVVNFSRRAALAEEIRTTQASFSAFIAKYQISVKERKGTPAPAKGCA